MNLETDESTIEIIRASEEEVKSILGEELLLTNDSNLLMTSYPTPSTFSLMQKIYSFEGALGRGYKRVGIKPESFETAKYLVKIIGRAFINLREDETLYLQKLGLKYELDKGIPHIVSAKGSLSSKFNKFLYSLNNAWLISNFSLFLDELQLTSRALEMLPEQPGELADEIESFIDEYSYIVSAGILYQLLWAKEQTKRSKNEVTKRVKGDKYMMNLVGNRADSDFELFSPRWHEIDYTPTPFTQTESLKDPESDLEKIALVKNNLRFNILNRVARIRKIIGRIGDFAFFLTIDEILNGEIVYEKAAERRKQYELETSIPYDRNRSGNNLNTDIEQQSEKTLRGNPVSPGEAAGKLMTVDSPSLMRKLDITKGAKEKPIILLPHSGPEFTPIYKEASGLIFGKGGMLSHGAIIAREYGIPALIFTDIETLKKYEHKRVEINATTGQIRGE